MPFVLMLVFASGSLQGCLPVVAAGVGTGIALAQERRSKDTLIEDKQIEIQANDSIEKQFSSAMHVNVTSYNHNVLITGEVPDEATKAGIGMVVAGIKNVRDINNELAISGVSSIASRSNDGLITSNLKLRFVNEKRFNAEHVKVITENGTVYLLGIVNRSEADAAAEIASTSKGARQVVKIFEYLD
ncbi:MAG: BON domain-containing protein [Nitrosomonadales bacterium]|nr:BON domain-containing protein [Nitrosomonadales bacterium]